MTQSSDTVRLSFREKAGYALGDLAFNFYWKTLEAFALIFYTDVFGISAAAAGSLFLVVRILDAVSDPVMGILADRTQTRYGKFRPYLVWFALPLAASGVLTFTTPDLEQGKLIWAYVTYAVMMLMYTAANIPYSAMLGVITHDSHERTQLSSFRFMGAFAGGVIVWKFTQSLVRYFGGDNPAQGWQYTMMLYGVIAVALLCVSFATTKERVAPPPGQHSTLRQDGADLLANRPWIVLFLLGLLLVIALSVRNGCAAFYFKYYVGDEMLLAWFLTAGALANIAGAALTPLLTRLLGKVRLYQVLMLVMSVLTLAYYVVPPTSVRTMFVLNIAVNFALGPKSPLVWSMYADSADYSEWKTGRRATGLIFSAAIFATKLGGALGGAISGWLLASAGYRPNAEQTPAALQGILLLMSVIPAVLGILGALAVRLYPLKDHELREIQADLTARRLGTA